MINCLYLQFDICFLWSSKQTLQDLRYTVHYNLNIGNVVSALELKPTGDV